MPKLTAQQLIREIEVELTGVKDSVRDLDYEIKSLQTKAELLELALGKVEAQLIPKVEYDLVKKVIFGAVGLILIGVTTSIIAMTVKQ